MSSEKQPDGETRELSEFEALLSDSQSAMVICEPPSPTLDRLAGSCSGGLGAIIKRFKELADQESAYKLKYRQMINKRQIHDAAIEQRGREEEQGEANTDG